MCPSDVETMGIAADLPYGIIYGRAPWAVITEWRSSEIFSGALSDVQALTKR